jgi:ribulose-phosphate 3-epimerase
MDGHFVPPLTFGADVASAVRRCTTLPLDAHLMVSNPEAHIEAFAAAGVETIIVHIETTTHLHKIVQDMRDLGIRPGVTLNPGTPLSALDVILPEIDQVQIMSVNPGWGGQSFIPSALDRIRELRASLDAINSQAVLQVDGGVNVQTIAAVIDAGAELLVAGSAVFNDKQSVSESMAELRAAMPKS